MSRPLPSKKALVRTLLWVSVISLIYCGVWFITYSATPLGISPALDNQQTLELANQMANGDLPSEPFHRAPLYPYLLSIGLSAGVAMDNMPALARALNALALVLCTAVVTLSAIRIWKSTLAGWITGLLVGMNPVILFFAADPFDILLATACLCLALSKFIGSDLNPSKRDTFTIGLLLAVGAALRSHLLPLALAWPIACLFLRRNRRPTHLALAATPLILSFVILGWVNLRVSGEFRMLPWQSAYNLYAGNGPDASGRIYAQQVPVNFGERYDNPAKLESIALYEAETGLKPPHSIDDMNTFWKQKAFLHIQENPTQWIGLMLRKAYYFLNNYEQYDNKTYGLHKQLYAPLRWNPLHWGLLLILAVAGTLIGLRSGVSKKVIYICIAVFALYAAGTIWFYTSNRFRVPMIPVLCLLAGGIVSLKPIWIQSSRAWRLFFAGCLSTTALISYSAFFEASNTDTWEADYALLANAALRVADDKSAIYWANRALKINALRSDVSGTIVQAKFNQWALNQPGQNPTRHEIETFLEDALQARELNPAVNSLIGIYQWKLGQFDAARQTWEQQMSIDPFALLCLYWTGQVDRPTITSIHRLQGEKNYPILLMGLAESTTPTVLTETLDQMMKPLPSFEYSTP